MKLLEKSKFLEGNIVPTGMKGQGNVIVNSMGGTVDIINEVVGDTAKYVKSNSFGIVYKEISPAYCSKLVTESYKIFDHITVNNNAVLDYTKKNNGLDIATLTSSCATGSTYEIC